MKMDQTHVRDWENPQILHRKRASTHATLIPFADQASACKDDREASPIFRLLNGSWRFFYGTTP